MNVTHVGPHDGLILVDGKVELLGIMTVMSSSDIAWIPEDIFEKGSMPSFSVGDKVKWIDVLLCEMRRGEITYFAGTGSYATVLYDTDANGLKRFMSVPVISLWLDDPVTTDWNQYLSADEPIVVPSGKKGYEPDGFNREAFDDFMRNL